MELLPLIIQLISGAVGGTALGAAAKNLSLGTAGNSIVGALGGLGGGTLLGGLMAGGGEMAAAAGEAAGGADIGALIGQVGSGAVGGGVLMAIVGVVKKMMTK